MTIDCYATKMVDSYVYIENFKDPQIAAWFREENDYTRGMLAKIPGRDALLARIKDA